MKENAGIHVPVSDKFGSVINSPEFKEIVKACDDAPLFSHRYAEELIKLLSAHAIDDPDLLLLAEIGAEMGVAENLLLYPDTGDANCEISDVMQEEHAVYGDARTVWDSAPKAVTDRNGSTHRRPKVSVFKLSGDGLHVGFYRDLPLVVRKAGAWLEAPHKILPKSHQMINLIGGLPSDSLDSSVKTVKNAVFIGDNFAFTNYAHWTLDWFPRLKWIIEEHGDAADLSVVFNRRPSPFHFEMLESVGFNRANLLFPDAFTPTFFLKAENVYATNIGREFRHAFHAGASWAIDFARESLSDDENSPFAPGIRVAVTRPHRGIVYSDGALSALKDKGFIFVRLERMEYKTQVALFANASAVIAPHGAGLSNLVFCKPGTHVLEVFNGSYGTHAFYTVAHFGGLDYSCTVGEPAEDAHAVRPIHMNCLVDEPTISRWLSGIGF